MLAIDSYVALSPKFLEQAARGDDLPEHRRHRGPVQDKAGVDVGHRSGADVEPNPVALGDSPHDACALDHWQRVVDRVPIEEVIDRLRHEARNAEPPEELRSRPARARTEIPPGDQDVAR